MFYLFVMTLGMCNWWNYVAVVVIMFEYELLCEK